MILLDCVLFKECMRKSLCFGVFGIVKLYGGLVGIGCYLWIWGIVFSSFVIVYVIKCF